ncbi:hypothetical protein WICPIJ_001230 [Wickerhamomyces pijperi]|uniref:Uncharacterized protein n=1 Tax=Wickerhamomyces pijperi TaxID=599730 RepID=A0A9P8QC55_WICPI|nr:hypothetical protein WICPIJ_001230 [Wickerhamomyces pijperi]
MPLPDLPVDLEETSVLLVSLLLLGSNLLELKLATPAPAPAPEAEGVGCVDPFLSDTRLMWMMKTALSMVEHVFVELSMALVLKKNCLKTIGIFDCSAEVAVFDCEKLRISMGFDTRTTKKKKTIDDCCCCISLTN